MSRKCRAFSASKLGLAPAYNRAAFYAGWEAALEQPGPEPVAYLYHDAKSAHDANPLVHSTLLVLATERRPECRNETPLYAGPPRREWRGLTDERIVEFGVECGVIAEGFCSEAHLEFARAVEDALRERNA